MSDRAEYWWIEYESGIQPAEVIFRAGIPTHARIIGASEAVSAVQIELIERLPLVPKGGIMPPAPGPAPQPGQRSGTLMWLFGFIIIVAIFQFSGYLFDMLQ